MKNDAVLLVFAKAPSPGAVKTRLAGDASVLSEEESARLYSAFLKDALAQYLALSQTVSHALAIELHWSGPLAEAEPYISHAERTASSDVKSPVQTKGPAINLVEQEGEGLGARMAYAFHQALESYERAFIIGTDHPTLPDSFIEEALHVLRGKPALCIGPSTDGGYYGLGMNRWTPDVFADMTYSHAYVFANTLRRAARTDMEVTVLPEFYDVDTPTALRKMLQDLRDTVVGAPETRRVVRDMNLCRRLGVEP
jgi:hypothetical protein